MAVQGKTKPPAWTPSDLLTMHVQVNDAFRQYAAGPMKGILAVSDEPLVSVDFRCTDVSTSIDSSLTMVMVRPLPAGSLRQPARLCPLDCPCADRLSCALVVPAPCFCSACLAMLSGACSVQGDDMVKVVAWYDNGAPSLTCVKIAAQKLATACAQLLQAVHSCCTHLCRQQHCRQLTQSMAAEWGYSQRVVDLAELTATKWE